MEESTSYKKEERGIMKGLVYWNGKLIGECNTVTIINDPVEDIEREDRECSIYKLYKEREYYEVKLEGCTRLPQ